VQSSVFGCWQPWKLSAADGQVVPSMQHWLPAQKPLLVPGHSTESPTAHCTDGCGAGGPGGPGGGGGLGGGGLGGAVPLQL